MGVTQPRGRGADDPRHAPVQRRGCRRGGLVTSQRRPDPQAGVPKRNRWAEAAERRLTPHSWFAGLFRQWPLIVTLSIVVAGLIVVADDHFLRGTVLIGLGVCVAILLRAVLPVERAGVLHVRSRAVDVLTLAFFGFGTVV